MCNIQTCKFCFLIDQSLWSVSKLILYIVYVQGNNDRYDIIIALLLYKWVDIILI
jgi:hypothetical protein